MLFMKGNPSAPECGFSRTIVGLLPGEDIEFDSFDILTDNAVREGLKEFSEWPTYPQLYVEGTLVGGLDIVKEMVEDEVGGVPASEAEEEVEQEEGCAGVMAPRTPPVGSRKWGTKNRGGVKKQAAKIVPAFWRQEWDSLEQVASSSAELGNFAFGNGKGWKGWGSKDGKGGKGSSEGGKGGGGGWHSSSSWGSW